MRFKNGRKNRIENDDGHIHKIGIHLHTHYRLATCIDFTSILGSRVNLLVQSNMKMCYQMGTAF